jgi:hypothetical protein
MSNNGGGGGAPGGRGGGASGFGNFMNDIIGGGGGGGGFGRNNEPPPYAQHRPPPPPIATKGPVAPPPPIRQGATAMPTPMSMPQLEQKTRRPEMRGPTADVSDMMSRLKTKTINIQPMGSNSAASNSEAGNLTLQNILSGMTGSGTNGTNGTNDEINLEPTVVNVSSLGELPQDSIPHKSKRRPRSERNTVSMDL